MTAIANGGRGKKAPYETIPYRLPAPLKAATDKLAANYRELLANYEDSESPELVTTAINSMIEAKAEQNTQKPATGTKSEKAIIKSVIKSFLEAQIKIHGKNGSQQGKEFSLNTRRWDAFREFQKFVETL